MNKEDIKKALECCITLKAYSCKECPYGSPDCNIDKLHTDALNLITEQEKEIDELKDDYAKLQNLFAQYQMASDKEIRAQVKQAKIDVLNELKEKSKFDGHTVAVYKNDIDELIKELIK